MQTDPITTSAACDLGRHAGSGPAACKSVVLTLTGGLDAPLVDCTCPCHGRVRDLPDPWKAQAVLTPPCDEDVVIEDDELKVLMDIEADRRLEDEWIGAWS